LPYNNQVKGDAEKDPRALPKTLDLKKLCLD